MYYFTIGHGDAIFLRSFVGQKLLQTVVAVLQQLLLLLLLLQQQQFKARFETDQAGPVR